MSSAAEWVALFTGPPVALRTLHAVSADMMGNVTGQPSAAARPSPLPGIEGKRASAVQSLVLASGIADGIAPALTGLGYRRRRGDFARSLAPATVRKGISH
jgi:hypothetical protein